MDGWWDSAFEEEEDGSTDDGSSSPHILKRLYTEMLARNIYAWLRTAWEESQNNGTRILRTDEQSKNLVFSELEPEEREFFISKVGFFWKTRTKGGFPFFPVVVRTVFHFSFFFNFMSTLCTLGSNRIRASWLSCQRLVCSGPLSGSIRRGAP